ncbi:MAG: aspartyl-phosphate phosphatase Spo0E family protein [Bacillus sp. (in: firmicutes)]
MNQVTLELLLLKRIDRKRQDMVEIAFNTGINSQKTLKCSQELDILLNLHLKLFANKVKIKDKQISEF